MLEINIVAITKLYEALKEYQGNAEDAINDVLHNQGGELIQNSIQPLIPVSDKKKGTHAKSSNSLRTKNENLAVTVRTQKKYQYLYFPDDGTSTRRHVGNQQFFRRGAEAVKDEIIERCISKLTNNFEKGV